MLHKLKLSEVVTTSHVETVELCFTVLDVGRTRQDPPSVVLCSP